MDHVAASGKSREVGHDLGVHKRILKREVADVEAVEGVGVPGAVEIVCCTQRDRAVVESWIMWAGTTTEELWLSLRVKHGS